MTAIAATPSSRDLDQPVGIPAPVCSAPAEPAALRRFNEARANLVEVARVAQRGVDSPAEIESLRLQFLEQADILWNTYLAEISTDLPVGTRGEEVIVID